MHVPIWLLLTLVIALIVMYYLFIVVESYARAVGFFGSFRYGFYRVEMMNETDHAVVDVKNIRAWNGLNAVERVGKKLDDVNNVVFRVTHRNGNKIKCFK